MKLLSRMLINYLILFICFSEEKFTSTKSRESTPSSNSGTNLSSKIENDKKGYAYAVINKLLA
jgi:hypothetical protein